MFSNAEILAAVVTRWAMPMACQLMDSNMSKIPFLESMQCKLRSTGWVSPSWRISNEMMPFTEPVIKAIVTPMMTDALRNIPDEQIPAFAHGVVDNAMKNGCMSLFEGNVVLDSNDLCSLKKLLTLNLPIANECLTYEVKEE